MSRTMTISSWSASNVTVRCCAGILVQPGRRSPRTSRRFAPACGAARRGRDPRRSPRGSRAPRARSRSRSTAGVSTVASRLAAFARARVSHGLVLAWACVAGRDSRRPARPSVALVRPRTHIARARSCDLIGLERLVLDQDAGRQAVEHRPVLGRGSRRAASCAPSIRHAHLGVDPRRDLVGVVGRGREVAAEEHLALRVAEPHRAEPLRSCRTR